MRFSVLKLEYDSVVVIYGLETYVNMLNDAHSIDMLAIKYWSITVTSSL